MMCFQSESAFLYFFGVVWTRSEISSETQRTMFTYLQITLVKNRTDKQ